MTSGEEELQMITPVALYDNTKYGQSLRKIIGNLLILKST